MATAKRSSLWASCIGILILLTTSGVAYADVLCPGGGVMCIEVNDCSNVHACDDTNQPCCFQTVVALAPSNGGGSGISQFVAFGVDWLEGRVDSCRGSVHSLQASLPADGSISESVRFQSDVVEWVFARDAERLRDAVGVCIASNLEQPEVVDSACWSVTSCLDAREIEGTMYILDSQAVSAGNILCGDDIVGALDDLLAALGLADTQVEQAIRSSYSKYRGYLDADAIPGPPNQRAARLRQWARRDTFQ